jgi:hypothetical protein
MIPHHSACLPPLGSCLVYIPLSESYRVDSPTSFLPVEQLIHTMLHELVHIEIGPHDDRFYRRLDQVRVRLYHAPTHMVLYTESDSQ